MSVAVVLVCKNEERVLPFTLRHYAQFADEIVVYDNGSTDRTRDIIAACPKARRVDYDTGGVLRDDVHAKIKGDFATQCDWRVAADCDELLWHTRGVRTYLDECARAGITAPLVRGFDMIGDGWPIDDGRVLLTDVVTKGFPNDAHYAKPCVVSRDTKVVYGPGAHYCSYGSPVTHSPTRELCLLHYRWVDHDSVIAKMHHVTARLSNENRANGWGLYDIASEELRYAKMLAERQEVVHA